VTALVRQVMNLRNQGRSDPLRPKTRKFGGHDACSD
jgi:hypothetical protein